MKTLYHLALDEDGQPKTAVFIDGNGRRYEVPYDEPTEFESDFMAGKLVEHLHYFGLIEINRIKTRHGIEYDLDEAKDRALKTLEISEKACINDYIKSQLEDRVRQNFPPLPPVGRALECCVKHKYNLLRAGIRCIGWEPPYQMDDPGFGQTPAANDGSVMKLITELQAQLLQQNALIMQLFQQSGGGKGKKPAKADDEELTRQPSVAL